MRRSMVLLLLLALCATPALAIDVDTAEKLTPEQVQPTVSTDYLLGTDDILDISILQPEQMLMTVTVAPDGTITFPYIGNVKVKDMTLAAVQELIQSRLADGYMKYPVVAVSLREVRSKKIFIYGEVLKPGTYILTDKKTTILNAITMAGGFTKAGSAGTVKVLRPKKDGKGSDAMDIDIKAAMASSAEADAVLQPEDTVVVTEAKYFVYGDVMRSGGYPLEEDTAVLKAISTAGGFIKYGASSRVKILRPKKAGGSETIDVDAKAAMEGDSKADIMIQAGDTVVVSEDKYFVYGDVNRPGSYPIVGNTGVLKAISIAGGFVNYGTSSKVKVLRPKEDGVGSDSIDIDVKAAMDGAGDADRLILPGDTIMVSAEKYYVYGEVNKPGVYPLEDNTTVVKAISIAGGFGKFGSTSRVKILRPKADDTGNETIKVNMKAAIGGTSAEDTLIKSGDTVVVEEGVF